MLQASIYTRTSNMISKLQYIEYEVKNIVSIFKSLLKIAFFIKMIIIFILVIRVLIIIINEISI